MGSFNEIFEACDWDETSRSIYSKTTEDVEHALSSGKRTLEDFKALISPAAVPYLEQMAQISQQLTLKRFGRVVQMYVPLYLSNECNNICTYCGFSYDNKVRRKTLSPLEVMQEVAVIKEMGFDHVLLVTGEANQSVHMDYFKKILELIRPHFAQISMEVQPLDLEDFRDPREKYTIVDVRNSSEVPENPIFSSSISIPVG